MVLVGFVRCGLRHLFYAWRDPRVTGFGVAEPLGAYTMPVWRRLCPLLPPAIAEPASSGENCWAVAWMCEALCGFWSKLRRLTKLRPHKMRGVAPDQDASLPLPQRMLRGLQRFNGQGFADSFR